MTSYEAPAVTQIPAAPPPPGSPPPTPAQTVGHGAAPASDQPERGAHPIAGAASVVVWAILGWTWGIVSLTLLISGIGSLPAALSGVLLLIPWILLMRLAAIIEQRRAAAVHGIQVTVPSRRISSRTGFVGFLHRLWLDVTSLSFWGAALHHHLAMLSAVITGTIALVAAWIGWTAGDIAVRAGGVDLGERTLTPPLLIGLGVLALLVALVAIILGVVLDRILARTFLSRREQELKEQVTEMTERRQGAVDAAEQERLRIERDLHDGVQPRLVALAMTLGIAKSKITTDPERATELVGEAHTEAKAVITDLRQLARGIHPAVLTDRGLDAALSALAARSPIPVDLVTDLPGRLGREVEGVAYFVVSETLTNSAKHSGAARASVRVQQRPDLLEVVISDDGRGGAAVHRAGLTSGHRTGLAGLSDRVRAAGGTFDLQSSAGTGTRLRVTLPLHRSPQPAVPGLGPAPAPAPAPTMEDPR